MISCIVIDDEPKAIDVLKRYVEKISFLELKKSFRDPILGLRRTNGTIIPHNKSHGLLRLTELRIA